MTDLNIYGGGATGMPTTSGSFNFSVTRDDIIREAMLNLALLEENELPTAQEVNDCARKLNMIVKQLAGNMDKAPGFKMFQRQRGDLFGSPTQFVYNLGRTTTDHWSGGVTGLALPTTFNAFTLSGALAPGATLIPVTSTAAMNIGDQIGIVIGSSIFWTTILNLVANTSVTLPAPGLPAAASAGTPVYNYTQSAERPVEILTGLLRDSTNTDTPLNRMSLEIYEALPTKVQPGYVADPTAFYYEAQMANNMGQLYIDCSGFQDVTKRLHFVYLRESQDFDNPGDAPEFPQEWFMALSWMLSLQICGMFDGDWTPDRQAAFLIAIGPAREANAQTDDKYFQVEEDSY